jgi:hypothetical protein
MPVVSAGGGEALGGGKDVLKGVLGPRGAGGDVGDTAAQIHHAVATDIETQRSADLPGSPKLAAKAFRTARNRRSVLP